MQTLNDLFTIVASFLRGLMASLGFSSLLADVLMGLVSFVAVAALVTVNIIVILWVDRRFAAFFQERLGPNRVGPFGLLQSVNDAVKLIGKESIMPAAVDKRVYKTAPILIFAITMVLYGFLPYGKGMSAIDMSAGLLFFIAISSTSTIAILMAGWGSNNKYSLLGGMRSVAQVISYEIPLAFSMVGVVMLSGSMNLGQISAAQHRLWFVALQPVGFFVFIVAALAELAKSPFDMTEAEQGCIAGYHTEYSGMRFALFFMAEYANLFCMAALGATLFLGGWEGPILPGYVWFVGKTWALVLVLLWLRWTLPRARLDQMMKFNWKFLIPLSILNILLTGGGIKLYQFLVAAGEVIGMLGIGLIQGLYTTAKRFLMRKVTQGYPEVLPDLPARSKGSFGFDADACISCGLCEDACPNGVIRVEYFLGERNRKQLERYSMNLGFCLFCGLCVEACPKDAIFFKTDFELACYRKDDTVFVWKGNTYRPAAPAEGPAAPAAKPAPAGSGDDAVKEA